MKRIIYVLPFLLLSYTGMFAQGSQPYTGSWEGILHMGIDLRLIFHVKENTNGFSATADSPDQGAYGIKCDTAIVSPDGIRIEMRNLKAVFTGKLVTDSLIDGTFTQGQPVAISLKRSIGDSKPVARKRPQTPVPPFPYKSEDIEYDNKDKSLHYGATLTIPPGKGPFPGVLLITGSGAQNRDENIMGHKIFAVLADALTKNGLVVLRVDDRGIGKSSGNFNDATSADFASDVATSYQYLLSRPEVNKKKAGMIGHSEGGMIAPMVALGRKDVDFIILLAGPGIKIDQLMAEQNGAILRSAGISRPSVDAYIPVYKKLMNVIITAPDAAAASISATIVMQQWAATTDTSIVKELGLENNETRQKVVDGMVQGFSSKWFKYFLAFDPQPYLQKLRTKVLALNGDKDIQVIASSNLAGIESSLKKSKSKKYVVKQLPGLNHLFQTCTSCSIQEYLELEETFSTQALKEINDWLTANVK